MDKSHLIARLVGPVLCTIGVGMLLNSDTYRQIAEQFLQTSAFIYITGVLLLTAGLAILNAHPLWTADWRSLITLVGWIATVAGVWRIFAPRYIPFVGNMVLAHPYFFIGTGIALVALGGFITFKGYSGPANATELETQQ